MIFSPLNSGVTKSELHGAKRLRVCYKRQKLRKSFLISETKFRDIQRRCSRQNSLLPQIPS
jgi:hypothetical protein